MFRKIAEIMTNEQICVSLRCMYMYNFNEEKYISRSCTRTWIHFLYGLQGYIYFNI